MDIQVTVVAMRTGSAFLEDNIDTSQKTQEWVSMKLSNSTSWHLPKLRKPILKRQFIVHFSSIYNSRWLDKEIVVQIHRSLACKALPTVLQYWNDYFLYLEYKEAWCGHENRTWETGLNWPRSGDPKILMEGIGQADGKWSVRTLLYETL